MTKEAEEPAKVATARQIVTLLVKHGLEAGDWTQNAMVTKWAAEIDLNEQALGDALIAAGELNWIDNGPLSGTILLTKDGFDAGASS